MTSSFQDETVAQTASLKEMLAIFERQKEPPFKKAIHEFKAIMGSAQITPLDKLYKLQFIALKEPIEKHKDYIQKYGPITRDEKTPILTYIIIQSGIPDLAS